jgi:hypothetical protein
MAYFEDLSDYRYGPFLARPNVVNVGWLSKKHEFCEGPTTPQFRSKLYQFCMFTRVGAWGFHACEFCGEEGVSYEGLRLGSAEIRVFGEARVYAAPNLILHYVHAHHYLPPAEFVEAVMTGPIPPGDEYERRLTLLGSVR